MKVSNGVKKGVTIIELLVTMSVIAILSAVLFVGKLKGEEKLTLQRSAYNLMQELRASQALAIGGEEEECEGGIVTHSFGVHFKLTWEDHYILFADCDASYTRKDDGKEDIKVIYFEKGIQISGLSPSSDFSIVFEPPDPVIYINKNDWGEEAVITLALGSNQRKVKINTAGRIEIE